MNSNVILNTKKVLDIEGKFWVPSYQRGYRWGKSQVRTLLDDLYEAASTPGLKDKDYCLQPVVVKYDEANDRYELVDGQQRLTTLYLLQAFLVNQNIQEEILYSLEYETRQGTKSFLENIERDKAEDNVDFYHIYNAYETIKLWSVDMFPKSNERRSQLNKLFTFFYEHVKVIWYEVNDDEDSRSLFTRLNIGRIQLTNAELVRALFLRRKDENEVGRDELEIAIQWDSIEKEMRADNDDFWYFMTKKNPETYPTRIELLFDMISRKNKIDTDDEQLKNSKQDDYYTFFYFNDAIGKDDNNQKKDVWNNIVNKYLMLKEWYKDNELYHKIGYLIASGQYQMVDIFDVADGKTKSEFKSMLKQMIANTINWPYYNYADELTYEKSEDKKRLNILLLLFNVMSILKRGVYQRFPFREYNSSAWSLEHIHAQQSEGLNKLEEQKGWIELQLPVVKGMDESEVTIGLVEEMESFLENDDKPSSSKTDQFKKLYKDISGILSVESNTERMHNLENMALLQKDNNAALNNSTFGVKRNKIIEMDKNGMYIPYCTKMVFLKYYTNTEDSRSKFYYWAEEDRTSYINEIRDVLAEYLNIINKKI